MLRIRPLNLVLPLLVLLAGACAAPTASPPAPTAPPPTLAPTAVAPTLTAVPPTLAPTPTAVPPTLAPTTVPATLAPTPDLLAPVTAFQAAYNQKDTDTLMALFAADPSWTLRFGLFAFAGSDSGAAYSTGTTQGLRDLLDIGFKLNSHLEASNCGMKNTTATCDLVIKDDCNPPAASAYHIRTQFDFQDGKITSVHGGWDVSEQNVFVPYDGARQEWARQHLPAEAAQYNAFSPDNGHPGLPPGETASQFGQAMERICTGYAAAA
jgi:hypothetical protein